MSTNTDDEILIERHGLLVQVTLNRPAALNALSHNMIQHLLPGLDAWEKDPGVTAILFKGAGGKAFCAGGDIKSTWLNRAHVAANDHYFYDEYNLNRRLFHYTKPLIALMDGITMGGGYGVAGYCDYKIATENTRWAMPETGIGFFPDIGSTYELSRMPGALGLFLALSGITTNAEDAFYAGVATHYMLADKLPSLIGDLIAGGAVASTTARYHQAPVQAGPIQQNLATIERCFAQPGVPDILDALAVADSEWAQSILALLQTRSPLSLCVTFERMKRARAQDFDQLIELDYVIARHFMRGDEFFEGVRAMLIDKDKIPQWQPASVAEVSETAVSRYFEPLPGRLAEGFKG